MKAAKDVLKKYHDADEDQRTTMYLFYRRLRDTFDAIEEQEFDKKTRLSQSSKSGDAAFYPIIQTVTCYCRSLLKRRL